MSNTKDSPMDYKQFEGATPGPWKSNAMYSRVVNNDDDVEICEVAVNHKNEAFSYNEWRANSRLLASAPDLLKENQSLKLELQKQKELNAELVDQLQLILNVFREDMLKADIRHYESLIKKSSEI